MVAAGKQPIAVDKLIRFVVTHTHTHTHTQKNNRELEAVDNTDALIDCVICRKTSCGMTKVSINSIASQPTTSALNLGEQGMPGHQVNEAANKFPSLIQNVFKNTKILKLYK